MSSFRLHFYPPGIYFPVSFSLFFCVSVKYLEAAVTTCVCDDDVGWRRVASVGVCVWGCRANNDVAVGVIYRVWEEEEEVSEAKKLIDMPDWTRAVTPQVTGPFSLSQVAGILCRYVLYIYTPACPLLSPTPHPTHSVDRRRERE